MKYTKKHDRLRVDGNNVGVGITEFATEQLGDIVSVALPELGTFVTAGDEVVAIESIKAADEILAVYKEQIVAANKALVEEANLVNEDSAGRAWFFKVKLAEMKVRDNFMGETTYLDKIA